MKSTKTLFLTALTLAALTTGAWAENPASGAPAAKEATPAPAPPPITAADVQALKDAMAAQQQQIERLTQQLQRQQAWQSQQPAAEAAAKTDAAQLKPFRNSWRKLSNVAVQQNAAPSAGLNLQETTPQTSAKPAWRAPSYRSTSKASPLRQAGSRKPHSCGAREPSEQTCPLLSIR